MNENHDDQRTLWCGNLSDKLTEEVLYELFLQAGPLKGVHIPKDKDGKQSTYGFITFKHFASVQYATELLNGIALYDKRINIKPRTNSLQRQIPTENRTNSLERQIPTENQKLTNQQNTTIKAIQDLDMLMNMGNNLLINNRHNNYNQTSNIQNNIKFSPYRRPENRNYSDGQHEDNRSNYSMKYRNNDRRNANRPYFNRQRRPENRNYSDGQDEDNRSNYSMKYRNNDRRNANRPCFNRR